jgi:hypothetical protein
MIDDPVAWAAVKAMFDSFRSAIGLVKDANELGGGSEQQKQVVTQALATASSSTVFAQVEMAKALGYQLCKCEFPPMIMRTVGSFPISSPDKVHKSGDPVFECPKCGFNNAGTWSYNRTKMPPT